MVPSPGEKARMSDWFRTIYRHAKKKEKSVDSEGHCAYRGVNGAKCFVGLLIPDGMYNEACERKHIVGALLRCDDPLGVLSARELDFLAAMQLIHDDWPVDMWEDKLIDMALRYKLKPNPK